MTLKKSFLLFIFLPYSLVLMAQRSNTPILDDQVVFDEINGHVAVEAEYFYKQSKSDSRQWYRSSKTITPNVGRDEDGIHFFGAANNSYIEILPDTRVTHADSLIAGINFSNKGGEMGILHYKVNIKTPGRYYVWVRAFSTGGEDNGLHVGFDNTWPEHGQRMQWCTGKNEWTWGSSQRTEKVHCGVPEEIYLDIDKAGIHDIQFSMREDGFEFDKFILTNSINFKPTEEGLAVKVFKGNLPTIPSDKDGYIDLLSKMVSGNKVMNASLFPIAGTNFYTDKTWLAINPTTNKEAKTTANFPFETGMYDVLFIGVGENDGQSSFRMLVNDKEIGSYSTPISTSSFEEGTQYNDLWENISLKKGDKITVISKIGSKDGKEYSRGRWAGIVFSPMTKGKEVLEKGKTLTSKQNVGSASVIGGQAQAAPVKASEKHVEVSKDGKGEIQISGELKQWHKVTLTLDGPFAKEIDTRPNPFTDYRMTVTFTHASGSPTYQVPAYFAADGNAGESSASEGTKWRAHLAPDKTGKWNYTVSFLKGAMVATGDMPWIKPLAPFNGTTGSFEINPTDKTGADLRAKGRLDYVGKHHLQFKGTGEYFYKAGSDAPETLLGYEDFDNTIAMKPKIPLKSYKPHLQDYKTGDPSWKNGKGKGLIGAINYLATKGVNVFSFLTYNAGGDGDNVWPFVGRNEKLHYDCSKLDQWQVVFDHGQSKGMYLHFKTQETENDDNVRGHGEPGNIPESLDGGDLGPERILYYRELIARFGYLLALNWNLGEENTQSEENIRAISTFFIKNDPYKHNVVLHTFPPQQDQKYNPLLGKASELTGLSLQNNWDHVFRRTLQWVKASDKAGKPWVVANDEQGSAGKGVPPDPGYMGFDEATVGYNIDDIRKQTLWGNIMAGGAGVEYYFGYQFPENDLVMEDFRSRDKSWDYCKVAIDFLAKNKIPFHEMKNRDELVGNNDMNKEKHCLAKAGEIYLVNLAYANTSTLDLSEASGKFSIEWFNPITGGALQKGSVSTVNGGNTIALGNAPSKTIQDWIVIVRKN